MTKRREKAKPQKPEQNKQLMAESEQKSEVVVCCRVISMGRFEINK